MHDADDNDPLALMARYRAAIAPDDETKKQAISSGMEAFDKKYASSFQGSTPGARLMRAAQALCQPFTGANAMKKTYLIAGGLCASVLTVGLITTTNLYDAREVTGLHVALQEPAPSTVSTPPSPPVPQQPAGTAQSYDRLAPKKEADSLASQEEPLAERRDDNKFLVEEASVATVPSQQPMAANKSAIAFAGGAVGPSGSSMPQDIVAQPAYHDQGRDKFSDIKTNPVKLAAQEPVSTFSVDVDTASYAFVRGSLNNNTLPQKDAVRIEEMINYFPYQYEAPASKDEPFKANIALLPTPWNKQTQILRVGIKGYELKQAARPHANLVFLLDTSGSMNEPNKLPLLKNSLKMLLDTLNEGDTVAIVTYAGNAGTALEPTKVKDKAKIVAALDGLESGGSTAGAEGIRQAYQLAEEHFDKRGVNRVMLATDGDFNVGITDPEELKSFVERKRESGIFLSVIGFGRGNYNDELMQVLAQNGNGTAAYIDTLSEARKVLVEEASASLFPIAKDVKIQVEFNPSKIAEYRLIGYETRMLKREDFNNDKIDAGDIGAGHTVTALYEITPVGSSATKVDPLRYGKEVAAAKPANTSDELAFVKIRYKQPEGKVSKLITTPVSDANHKTADADAKFATAVAAFGSLLRGDGMVGDYTYDDVIALAQQGKGEDAFGYRAEFINLVRMAKNAPALETLQ